MRRARWAWPPACCPRTGGARLRRRRSRRNMRTSATDHANQRSGGKRLSLAQARANRAKPDFANYVPPPPKFFGTRVYTTITIWRNWRNYIDWTPFFQTWELAGPFPPSSTTRKWARRRSDLFADAQKMLKKIVDEKWLTARAVIGFWPANQRGRRHPGLWRQGAEIPHRHPAHAAPADGARAGPAQSGAGRFHRPARHRRLYRRLCGHRRHRRGEAHQGASRRPRTIIPPSCCAPWPTAWPKPLPNACMRKCARIIGAMPPKSNSANDDLIAEKLSGHPPRAGLSRPARAQREGHPVQAAGCGTTRSASS